ncbi:MAG TPA: SagB/ThcOx family dehydrogenase [Thermoanaerobaculia bacterium]|nr:SagB/ThcOx family dehydrogenase [Thermoanaerobaculia bacterium]
MALLLASIVMTAATLPHVTKLPVPSKSGTVAVERALSSRRSVREFAGSAIGLRDLSQLLWAAQGITTSDGRRAAPSAGALYPLQLYLFAGAVNGLPSGVYRYDARSHALEIVVAGDRRRELSGAAAQPFVADAPAAIVITAVYPTTARKYGARAERYCAIEAGCASENVALQAVALGLGTVVVGAFDEARLRDAALMRRAETPLVIMPIGIPRDGAR